MTVMLRWFDESGYKGVVAALRTRYPNLLTNREYLERLTWACQRAFRETDLAGQAGIVRSSDSADSIPKHASERVQQFLV